MLPHITNNRKSASAIGVKWTLIPVVAALLCTGMWATAASNGQQADAAPRERQATLIPADSKFLASLRFWEKNKNQPQPTSNVPHRSPPCPHQQEKPAETRSIPVEQPSAPVTSPPATAGLAPEPPPIPNVEYRTGLGNAPLPEWSANFVRSANEREAPVTQEVKTTGTPYVSYSFDTRDWIESFPFPQEVRENTSPTMQVTSYRAPALHTSVPQSGDDRNDVGDENDWDGHATKLATIASIRDEINKLQYDQTAEAPSSFALASAVSVPAPQMQIVERPQIDLSPSYQKRLQYVQTCGVVVVQANFPLTEIASILDEIRLLQHDLTRYIGVPAAKEKIELCLFKDEKSYMDFLKEFFPRAPRDRRALYVKLDNQPGTLMVQKSKDNFEVDLRHEMTHAVIHASIPRVPIWLDEGLAKYFEVPPQDRAANHPYMVHIRRGARFGAVPFLDRLTKLETIDDMGAKEYRDSWAWTHFLIHRSPETHRLLAAYLQMLAKYPEMEGEYVETEKMFGIDVSVARVRETAPPIPSLKLYLDDMMSNQREAFRDHFEVVER